MPADQALQVRDRLRIRSHLSRLLKKIPVAYRLANATYGLMSPLHLKALVTGTPAPEMEWSERHLRGENVWQASQHSCTPDEWVLGYWNSRHHSHRILLLESLARFAPLESVLEVGCNCGPNLFRIAERFHDTRLIGIDINPVGWRRVTNCFQKMALIV